MVLDYKDVSFSFQDRKLRRRRRLAEAAAAVGRWPLLFFCGFRSLQAGAAVARIQDLLLAGRLDEAGQSWRQRRPPLFQRGNFRELRALNDLCHGRLPQAAARFAELRRRAAARPRCAPGAC